METTAPTMALSLSLPTVGGLFAERYDVLELVGAGGMGTVYRVFDRELDEQVALKILNVSMTPDGTATAHGDSLLARFRREVKLARKVTHPNVARTFDLGRHGSLRFITMEYITGPSLGEVFALIENRRFSLSDTLRIAEDISRGLAAAHAVGVVHRDLKPENIMIASEDRMFGKDSVVFRGGERVMITDFGIARLSENDRSDVNDRLTVGLIVGTPDYMAPEQVRGQDVDGRADVYALGVMCFEMLSGRRPFEGKSAVEIAAARLTTHVPDIRTVEPSLPLPVAELIASMLCVKCDERPDAQRVFERIEQLRGVARERLAPTPGTTTINTMIGMPFMDGMSINRIKSVAVLPFGKNVQTVSWAARDLGASIADSLATLKGVQVLPPGSVVTQTKEHVVEELLDLRAVAKRIGVDRIVDGSVRADGEKLRVNVRLIDGSNGQQLWGDHADGDLHDLFAIEDRIGQKLLDLLRVQVNIDAIRGPTDPIVRALYDRARVAYGRFLDRNAMQEAVELLRQAHAKAPEDPYVMSALAAALIRNGTLNPGEQALLVEAEDLALRALSIDDSIPDTYSSIGILRLQYGDFRSSVKAFREALHRHPRHAEAQSYLGRLLVESGNPEDGIRRLELALRLEPTMRRAWIDLARAYLLLGDREKFASTCERGDAAVGPLEVSALVKCRACVWTRDREFAQQTLDQVAKDSTMKNTPPWKIYEPVIVAIANDQPIRPEDDMFSLQAARTRSLAITAFFYQVSAEIHAISGRLEEAFAALEASANHSLIDLLWLDRCPALAPLRGHARFGSVRANVAARVAQMWS